MPKGERGEGRGARAEPETDMQGVAIMYNRPITRLI